MSRGTAVAAVLLAALAGLASVLIVAGGYVTAPSLPLDDAWAHAAHGRALATTGHLAGQAGDVARPASPLWAAAVAVPHLLALDTNGIVLMVKITGVALHVLAALMLLQALTAGGRVSPELLLGPALVAFHPDLISASLSGVEVPMAAAIACALLWAAQGAPFWAYGGLAAIAPFVRPDLAVLALAFPLLLGRGRRLGLVGGAALAGTLAAFGLMAGGVLPPASIPRQGLPPGEGGWLGVAGQEALGFTHLLDQFPVADAGVLLIVAVAAALYLVIAAPATTASGAATTAMLGGIAFCAVSFALAAPALPIAFSAQRGALPALPLLVGATPVLVLEGLRRALPARAVAVARIAVPVLLLASELLDAPVRYRHLANDARNLDEVQVAMARAVGAGPPAPVIWAADGGGALRYFGRGTVIDLSGASARAIEAQGGQAFLDAHRPDLVELAPGLSAIEGAERRPLPVMAFASHSPDTAGGVPERTPQRWLMVCAGPTQVERLRVADRVVELRCGGRPADREARSSP